MGSEKDMSLVMASIFAMQGLVIGGRHKSDYDALAGEAVDIGEALTAELERREVDRELQKS